MRSRHEKDRAACSQPESFNAEHAEVAVIWDPLSLCALCGRCVAILLAYAGAKDLHFLVFSD